MAVSETPPWQLRHPVALLHARRNGWKFEKSCHLAFPSWEQIQLREAQMAGFRHWRFLVMELADW